MTVDEIIKMLDLKPHPEGGFYKEIFRSVETVGMASLPDRYNESSSRMFQRESMEWQVPPSIEKDKASGTEDGAKAEEPAQAKVKTKTKEEWRPLDIPVTGFDPQWRAMMGGSISHPFERAWCTSIYYLLTADTFSMMHKLRGNEIWHFYMGDTVEMLNCYPDGSSDVIRLGTDIANGARPQHIVPPGVWQGSRLMDGGKYALMGCTMSPGFSASDFEEGQRGRLKFKYPTRGPLIELLTKPE